MSLTCSLPDLLVFLPYHVGFHLRDSLVVVALSDGRIDLVERVDLSDGSALTPETGERMVLGLARRAPTDLILVAFHDRGCVASALDGLADQVEVVAPLAAVVEVSTGRWRHHPDGPWQPLPHEGSVPLIAEYVGRGVAPLPGRNALADALRAAPEETLDERIAARDVPLPRTGLAAWRRLLAGEGDEELEDVVTALAFVTRVANRDRLLSELVPPCHDSAPRPSRRSGAALDVLDERGRVRGVLILLTRMAPVNLRPTMLSITAVWAWDCGDGALASIASELALLAEPGHHLSRLVRLLLECDVRPPAA